MDLPLRYDITIPQRATLRERIQLPIDCTDREVAAQVWEVRNGQRVAKILEFEVDWVSRATPMTVTVDGEEVEVVYADFYLVGAWQQTSNVLRQGVWDLLVVDGETQERPGERTYWLEGTASLNPGMTEA